MTTLNPLVRKCDYCEAPGVIYIFADSESICKSCLLRLPLDAKQAKKAHC